MNEYRELFVKGNVCLKEYKEIYVCSNIMRCMYEGIQGDTCMQLYNEICV